MSSLFFDIRDDQWPIVYHANYNVSFLGLERLHPFDAKKWRNIIAYLKEANLITDSTIVKPKEAKKSDLLVVHTEKYLKSLNWSANVARIAEIPCVALLPNFFTQMAYLKPMRLQTGGSILAGKLAVERGWAINVGGGFHHCCARRGEGFCAYADITLLIRHLINSGWIKTAMIVDLDAHQGNGHEKDFMNVSEVYIMDVYNREIYPRDKEAKRAIRRRVELKPKTEDLEYLLKVRQNLKAALDEFTPDLVVYNAGTDVLDQDPLGRLCVTAKDPLPTRGTTAMYNWLYYGEVKLPMVQLVALWGNIFTNGSTRGIIKRDEFVFETCTARDIPIVMLTSGGYQRQTARVIADSILNLHHKGLIYKYKKT